MTARDVRTVLLILGLIFTAVLMVYSLILLAEWIFDEKPDIDYRTCLDAGGTFIDRASDGFECEVPR